MTDFERLIRVLAEGKVEFILVGGVAAAVHGSGRLTQDVDVVYSRKEINLRRLATCLSPHSPYLRGAPQGLPFSFDEETLRRGLNFTLVTDLGDIDLLGEITGGGTYDDLVSRTIEIEVFGVQCRVLDLAALIAVKRAAGRPKDLDAIAELEVIAELTGRDSDKT